MLPSLARIDTHLETTDVWSVRGAPRTEQVATLETRLWSFARRLDCVIVYDLEKGWRLKDGFTDVHISVDDRVEWYASNHEKATRLQEWKRLVSDILLHSGIDPYVHLSAYGLYYLFAFLVDRTDVVVHTEQDVRDTRAGNGPWQNMSNTDSRAARAGLLVSRSVRSGRREDENDVWIVVPSDIEVHISSAVWTPPST